MERITPVCMWLILTWRMRQLIWQISSPVLLAIGLVGNILSLVVFQDDGLRSKISTLYLRAMSVADFGALIFGLLPMWMIHQFNYDITIQHDVSCMIRNFAFYSFADISIWLICALNFDRLIAVRMPHQTKRICTHGRTCIIIGFIGFLACLKNFTVLITRQVVTFDNSTVKCTDSGEVNVYYNEYIRPWLVIILVKVFPFVFICFCNFMIIKHVNKMKKELATMIQTVSWRKHVSKYKLTSMTVMCLTISLVFLVLTFPSALLLVGRPYWIDSCSGYSVAKAIGSLCQYTNNSINFVLYCMFGSDFRQGLRRVFRWRGSRRSSVTSLASYTYKWMHHHMRWKIQA